MVIAVPLKDGTKYLCEVQLNLKAMLEAKERAHRPYEIIRSKLPTVLKQACSGNEKEAKELENFIEGR